MIANKPSIWSSSRKELGLFVLLLVVFTVEAVLQRNALQPANLVNVARLIGIYGIMSIGSGIVIMTGGIELSVGSMLGLVGVLMALMLNSWKLFGKIPIPAVFAVLGAMLVPVLLGVVHGKFVTKVKLQPFVVTLCGLLIYRGLSRFICQDNTQGFGAATENGYGWLQKLTTMNVGPVPIQFLMLLAVAAVIWVVVHRSVYGRYLLAVGQNEEAARYSGIDSGKVITSAYVIAGVLTGMAGVLLAFYSDSISPSSHGESFELYGIAAAVLGGCSLRGGEGSVIGIVLGTMLLRLLANFVALVGIPSSLENALVGSVIFIGVLVDGFIKSRRARSVSTS